MNFLAHLALAGPSNDSRLGNLLGDFEKGTPEFLLTRFPNTIVDGIMMHRHLDRFTDDHPSFREARSLLAPERQRFAGIVVDIFYDHFLTIHWSRFHPSQPSTFINEVYHLLNHRSAELGQLRPFINRLTTEDWLNSYRDHEGLTLTLERLSQRSPRLEPIRHGVDDLLASPSQFEDCFLTFYPEIRAKAQSLLGLKSTSAPAFP